MMVSYYFLINAKTCSQNSDYITENLRRRIELFELPMLESGEFAFKFLIVLLLCYNILFYFNYSSLPAANGIYIILLNINIEKLKIKAFQ